MDLDVALVSCDTQLCSTFHDLARAADNSSTTHAVILDFKKAFDKVPHLFIANWIQSFLTDKSQKWRLKGQNHLN